MVVVSRDGVFDPAAIHAAKRPIVLVQNSIHAGEMDGKDACLALLRDMVISKTKAGLLERAVFVFIPIYNADGHERRSAYNRINQDWTGGDGLAGEWDEPEFEPRLSEGGYAGDAGVHGDVSSLAAGFFCG